MLVVFYVNILSVCMCKCVFYLPKYMYAISLKAVMIKIIMFMMQNILLHILTTIPLDLRWQGLPKEAPKGAYFH